jgi:hypothetical protein
MDAERSLPSLRTTYDETVVMHARNDYLYYKNHGNIAGLRVLVQVVSVGAVGTYVVEYCTCSVFVKTNLLEMYRYAGERLVSTPGVVFPLRNWRAGKALDDQA